jgi:hypothetical protein
MKCKSLVALPTTDDITEAFVAAIKSKFCFTINSDPASANLIHFGILVVMLLETRVTKTMFVNKSGTMIKITIH